jgi:pilus assembly protein CpaB
MARINTGTMTVGIFAVLFGLIGAYALRAALTQDTPPPKEGPKTVDVPLANNELPAGRKITLGDMSLTPMTSEQMIARKYPLDTLMINTSQIIGRILKHPVKQGEAFLTTNLYPEGTGPDLSEKLKPGMRAFTIPIDDMAAVGAAAAVGSIVDVVFRTTPRVADKINRKPEIPQATVTLVEGAEVIAVGRNAALQRDNSVVDVRQMNRQQDSNALKSVTLAVSPEQANMLRTAMGRGELYLTLRNPNETGHSAISMMTLETLLGLRPLPPPTTIDIYRGTGRQSLTFDDLNVIDEKFGGIPNPPKPVAPVDPVIATPPTTPDTSRTAPYGAPPSPYNLPTTLPPMPTAPTTGVPTR